VHSELPRPQATTPLTSGPGSTRNNIERCARSISTAAKAGIGVGVSVAVLLVIGVSLFRYKSRKRLIGMLEAIVPAQSIATDYGYRDHKSTNGHVAKYSLPP
jgi:hypothetical protein